MNRGWERDEEEKRRGSWPIRETVRDAAVQQCRRDVVSCSLGLVRWFVLVAAMQSPGRPFRFFVSLLARLPFWSLCIYRVLDPLSAACTSPAQPMTRVTVVVPPNAFSAGCCLPRWPSQQWLRERPGQSCLGCIALRVRQGRLAYEKRVGEWRLLSFQRPALPSIPLCPRLLSFLRAF